MALGHNGPAPISHLELSAWCQITGNIVRREEIAILKAIDARYCAGIDKEADAIREREKDG